MRGRRATFHAIAKDRLIGDPRNNVHIFVSQLHLAGLRLHNCVVDHLRRSAAAPESAIFEEARRIVSWLHRGSSSTTTCRASWGRACRRDRNRGPRRSGRAPHRGSRSNSRTPPSATATARSVRSSSSTAVGAAAPVPRPARLPAGRRRAHHRLGPALRRSRPTAGAAREAIDASWCLPDQLPQAITARSTSRPIARSPAATSNADTHTAFPPGRASACDGETPLSLTRRRLAPLGGAATHRSGSTS